MRPNLAPSPIAHTPLRGHDDAPARPDAATRIPVRLKRVARGAFVSQLTQHVPAVLTVLTAGGSAIRSERDGGALALAVTELLVGALVLATIAREAWHLFARQVGHSEHGAVPEDSRIDGPGLAAAALGYVEVWHHAHEHGHFKLVSPYMLGATVTLVLALGGRRLIATRFRDRRPHVMVTRAAVTYRGSRRRRWTAAWDDVVAVEHTPGSITVRLRNGRAHVIRADEHFDGDALVDAARAAVATHAPIRLAPAFAPVTPA